MATVVTTDTAQHRFCTFFVAGQRFGLPVSIVREILRSQAQTPVPSADPVITGLINLRGEIVTAVDLRRRLGFPPADAQQRENEMNVVVRIADEVVSLTVDGVGEVIELRPDRFEDPPATVSDTVREMIEAVYQLDEGLVQILSAPTLLPVREKSTD